MTTFHPLKIQRSRLLALGALCMLSLCLPTMLWAQGAYPNKNVRVINPWPPGGPADIVARPIFAKLAERLGQPFVIENKAGANGVIGSALVAKAPADGYTLLFSHVGPIAISPSMEKDFPYNSVRDFEPITQIVSAPTVLLVRQDLPVKTFQELIAYAKQRPGKLSYGSVGPGSTTHLAGEMLQSAAGIEILHVPYKGAAPVLTDLMGGQIDMAFINISGAIPTIESGKLRGLAVSTLRRSSLLPQLPAIAEIYAGYEVNSWYGLMAPAGTPKPIVARLQAEVAQILKLPDIAQVLRTGGLDAEGTTPEVYSAKIKTDLTRWNAVLKATGLAITP